MKRNDIIEHLYQCQMIDEQMRHAIYCYYAYLDATEDLKKNPDVIYV